MIKLINILKEMYLDEAIVRVPQEILNKSKEVFNYIKSHLEDLKTKSPKSYQKPYIDSKFKDYFKFKDLKNQDLIVSMGLYNDSEDRGSGRMDTINDILLINLAYFNTDDLEDFEDTVEHELVHAMDPKVRDQKLFGVLSAKKGADPTGSTFKRSLDKSNPGTLSKSEFEKNYEKYLKSPWEFDAFTAPLINKLATNIKKSPTYRDILLKLLSDIKTQDIYSLIDKDEYEKMPWFFSKKEWTSENWSSIKQECLSELYKIKTWSTKPTLYKRFLSRLGKELI
tara:strand:- start:4577 stop:5422 length:846 start_codon:yes stop_codon:yes gene_type:complete